MHQDFQGRVQAVVDNIRQVVVADPEVIRTALLGLLCQGHVLLDDFPGVGKTLLAKALAQSLRASFKRVQFTPDLLPTDITGSSIYNPATREFQFVPGPVFANIVLADEINRASPRTQSALLEAMGEGQVTFDGVSHPLPRPFFVVATRNLAEQHGTFPLPQAQLDRFLLSFGIGYPDLEEEVEILERHEHGQPDLTPVLTAEEIVAMQDQISLVKVSRPVKEYIAGLVAASRASPDIAIGVSPRGAVYLQRVAQGRAAVEGRSFASPDDVKAVAHAVLRHRLAPRFSQPDAAQCIDAILGTLPVPL
ncbi:MAG: MoxR family ATPase [Chloroflexi bacterium]|nr:MoxR family ATPase [Chloroflexota bacterium]